jgi:hypothetical protein
MSTVMGQPATLLLDRGSRSPGAPAMRVVASAPSAPADLVVPKIGLQLPRQMPFETWLRIGSQLSSVVNSSAWCLGDWLAYGEVAYNGRYRDAIDRTSLDYQTLRNYAWVARRFSLSRRRDRLSFGHHAEVASLPDVEQDFWLRKAEELDWSRNHLRREVRASLRERDGAPAGHQDQGERGQPGEPRSAEPADARTDAAKLMIKVSPAQLETFEQAAGKVGLSVTAWAAQALEEAAKHTLPPEISGIYRRLAAS